MNQQELEYTLADAKEALSLAIEARREQAAKRYCAQIRDAAVALRTIAELPVDDHRIERIETASIALTRAIEAVAATRPNGRDYSAVALAEAEHQWETRLQQLQAVRAELWVGVE